MWYSNKERECKLEVSQKKYFNRPYFIYDKWDFKLQISRG